MVGCNINNIVLRLVTLVSMSTMTLVSCSTVNPGNIKEDQIVAFDTVRFKTAVQAGILNNKAINEASGMVMSMQNKNAFWTHNDSGDGSKIYLINDKAEYKLTCTISDAINRDWEDIAIWKDPISGKNNIFIADIGDNQASYPFYTIYMVEEPSVSLLNDITISKSNKIKFKYSDGQRDAESLLSDPVSGDLYIVTKREVNVSLYKITYPFSYTDTMTAEKVLTMPFSYIVGGDISRDGSEILLKTYQKIYYWHRKLGKTITETLTENPTEIPYNPEPQGEAICWSSDGKSFFTLSEESPFKIIPVLYRYDKE